LELNFEPPYASAVPECIFWNKIQFSKVIYVINDVEINFIKIWKLNIKLD